MVLEKQNGPLGRRVYSVFASTSDELAEAIHVPVGQHFVLLLAWDARAISDDSVVALARALVRRGLAYVVAWGPDCERVHDLFDFVDIEQNPESNIPDGDTVIMSTWHATEPLEHALWFSLHSAYPAPPYNKTCTATVAAAIASNAWAASIHRYLADPASLDSAVGL